MRKQQQPKAKEGDFVRLLVDVEGEVVHRTLPVGTKGVVVESYRDPTEGYAVDLFIHGKSLHDEEEYDNVILEPEQFDVIPHPCLLRVHSGVSAEALIARVAGLVGGRTGDLEVDTVTSLLQITAERRGNETTSAPPRYWEFRYDLWAEARPAVLLEAHAATIAAVLEGLWADGIPAVALCDFTHLLPDEGGRRWKGE